jgi:hypothetical protein
MGVRGITEQVADRSSARGEPMPGLEQRVVQVRLRYPDWSARKLRIVLLRQGMDLPQTPFITFYYVMVWFERKTTARQRCNVLNESNPTSYGRDGFQGAERMARAGRTSFVCLTITIVYLIRWPPTAARTGSQCGNNCKKRFSDAEFLKAF